MTDRIGAATPQGPERAGLTARRPTAAAPRPAADEATASSPAPAPPPDAPAGGTRRRGAPDPTGAKGRLVDVFA